MSNDPNRRIEQNRHVKEGHNTLETVKLEKQGAALPGWQKYVLYALAAVGAATILLFIASAIF